MDEIDQFLDRWVDGCVTFYRNIKNKYLALVDEQEKEIAPLRSDFKSYHERIKVGTQHHTAKQAFLGNYFGKDYAFQHNFASNAERMTPSAFDAWIRGIYEKDAQKRKAALLLKVQKLVGTITKADLYVGVDGGLNGFITGTEGKCSVEAIYAGGYNIQCLHFRTLIKLVKEKPSAPVKSTVKKLSSQKMKPSKRL